MRRGGTTLVVLVVAAIALAAGFDALRGGDAPQPAAESQPPATAPTTTFEAPEDEPPLADQLGGTLYYTDGNCELQAIELLGDGAVDPPNWDECRFVLSPDGRRVSGAGTGWDPYSDPRIGRVFQYEDGTIQVSSNGGPEGEPFAGTAPAWRPDGTLTFFADGAVREWPSGDVAVSQRELARAVRAAMPFEGTLQAVWPRQAAWLADGRLAAILSTRVGGAPSLDLLAVYDGDRLASFSASEPQALSDLRVSPQGNYVAAGSGGLVFLDSSGAEIETPALTGYRAIAWSPDDRWAAVATDTGVLVFRPGEPGPPELQLALEARDLDWRGELGPVAVSGGGDTTEATAFLAGAGVDGLLYVTQQDGGTCRLRALEIPGLQWAEAPPESEGFCRFTVEPDGLIHPGGVGGVAATPAGRPAPRRSSPVFGTSAALEEVAWVDEERFWAVVRSEGVDGIALMTTDALVYAPWFAAPRIEGLRVRASMVAASSDRGVAILDDGGRRRLIFTNGRDVAWAPGELIAAVSTRDEILFVAPVTGEVVSLPLEVADLDWVSG